MYSFRGQSSLLFLSFKVATLRNVSIAHLDFSTLGSIFSHETIKPGQC